MDESKRKGNQGEEFEHYRVLLFSIAYRMTGSASDAEDLVQETYLRYQASASQEIVSLKAYLSTIITRLALDYLKSARAGVAGGAEVIYPCACSLGAVQLSN
jgi:RNA polymerase sigma-70 factor (ECF subfamily)